MLRHPTHVVLGGTGHIGSAVARALLGAPGRVRVVTRSADMAAGWSALGAEPVVADIEDAAAMTRALASSSGVRVFALNPPGSIAGDPDADEDRTADALVAAIDAAKVERVVALSTYGARPGRRIATSAPCTASSRCSATWARRPRLCTRATSSATGTPPLHRRGRGSGSCPPARVAAVERTPPERWRAAFLDAGFSQAAAESFTGLTALADSDP